MKKAIILWDIKKEYGASVSIVKFILLDGEDFCLKLYNVKFIKQVRIILNIVDDYTKAGTSIDHVVMNTAGESGEIAEELSKYFRVTSI